MTNKKKPQAGDVWEDCDTRGQMDALLMPRQVKLTGKIHDQYGDKWQAVNVSSGRKTKISAATLRKTFKLVERGGEAVS